MKQTNGAVNIMTSVSPSKFKVTLYRCLFFLFGPIGRFLIARSFTNIEVVGKDNLKGGPYLVLMNHSCALDPILISLFGQQPLQFLISESFMRERTASKIISLFGHVAKRKLDFDPGSIQLLKRWADNGSSIALFPEGIFSIFSEPSPLMPGIEQLIRFLNLPVVVVHLANGDRVQPLWAKSARKTKVKITIHPAQKFTANDPILSIITRKLFNTDEPVLKFPSESNETALGLSKALRVCPACEKENTLRDSGRQLTCSACRNVWEIQADNMVTHPHDKSVKELFLKSFQITADRWAKQKMFHSLNTTTAYDISKGSWIPQSSGILRFGSEILSIENFSIPYADIQAHTQDWGDVMIIKTKSKRWAIETTGDSRAHFVNLLELILTTRSNHVELKKTLH